MEIPNDCITKTLKANYKQKLMLWLPESLLTPWDWAGGRPRANYSSPQWPLQVHCSGKNYQHRPCLRSSPDFPRYDKSKRKQGKWWEVDTKAVTPQLLSFSRPSALSCLHRSDHMQGPTKCSRLRWSKQLSFLTQNPHYQNSSLKGGVSSNAITLQASSWVCSSLSHEQTIR